MALMIAGLSACGYRHMKGGASPSGDLSGALTGTASGISFDDIRTKVLEPKCASCHTGQHNLNVEDYGSVSRELSKIRNRVLEIGDMPLNDSLSENEKDYLRRWIDAGGPLHPTDPPQPPSDHGQNGKPPTGASGPTGATASTGVAGATGAPASTGPAETLGTWANVQAKFFVRHCGQCHDSGDNAGVGLDVTDYQQLLQGYDNIIKRVFVRRDMPQGAVRRAQITTEDWGSFGAWVEAGRPGPSGAPAPSGH